LSELAHIDPEILSVGLIIPDFTEQEFVRQHLTRVLDEHAQQIILLGRQLYLFVSQLDYPPYEIDGEFACMEYRALALDLELVS
jgi:hypothetical protein